MAKHSLAKTRSFVSDLHFTTSSPIAKLLDSCVQSNASSSRSVTRVHARILKTQFHDEVFIHNRLIDVYGKCGCLKYARKLFDKMPTRNTFTYNAFITVLNNFGLLDEAASIFGSMNDPDQCSWNSMLSGFARHGRFDEALDCFVKMHRENYVLNEYSFGSAFSACAGVMDIELGRQIHGLVSKSKCSSDVYMGSALVDLYSKCRDVSCAQRAFDEMSVRNLVSWNSLITCFEQNGPASEALKVFLRMMDYGFEPDEVTLASVVSACASLSAVREGKEIHARVVKCDKLRNDVVLGNALVDMYSKCRRVNEARQVFDRMPVRNVVSETTMVSGYAKVASLKAARTMFTGMIEKNVVSWNALIAGYTQNGENEEAIRLFCLLKRKFIWPTHYTLGNLLSAASNLADLQLGQQIHTHILKHGFRFQFGEESDIFVGNSLIDMYMKCGSVEDGSKVFQYMLGRDTVSWNAAIVGYAQNGYAMEALESFKRMLMSSENPDHVTMIGVLSACSHAGLVEEGHQYFHSMLQEYGVAPVKDHYSCMVDLLGRAGCLDEAKDLIEGMPMQADAVVWGSFLAACKVHGNIAMGKHVAEKLLEIDPKNSGPYVLLSNMYAERKEWADVIRIRKLMKQWGVVKQPGCSWLEVLGQVHVFVVKDKGHPQKCEIYSILKSLLKQMKQAGYVPESEDSETYEELSELDSTFSCPMESLAVGGC